MPSKKSYMDFRYSGTSKKYRYVDKYVFKGDESIVKWKAKMQVDGHKTGRNYDSEREAALAIDKFLIGHGKEPVNILKRMS
jgi:hypothetical protein